MFGLALMQSALPALAQSGIVSQQMATLPPTVVSQLEGKWQITGNRELKQYPLISLEIHVNGNDVTATGDLSQTCTTSARSGSGFTGLGSSFGIVGKLSADGSFTLRPEPWPHPERLPEKFTQAAHIELTINGKLPAAGSAVWTGSYTITGYHTQCNFDQTGEFTASRMVPLTGIFSGRLMLGWTQKMFQFNFTAKQGDFISHERKMGLSPIKYLPLTGTITVKGSPCFEHGAAEVSLLNLIRGDLVSLEFTMDDGSKVSFQAYTNPQETELLEASATVHGGRCDWQNFHGTLSRL